MEQNSGTCVPGVQSSIRLSKTKGHSFFLSRPCKTQGCDGTDLPPEQEPAILAFSIPISILRLFLHLVDFDTDTDTRKSENFDTDSDTDTKVKQVL